MKCYSPIPVWTSLCLEKKY